MNCSSKSPVVSGFCSHDRVSSSLNIIQSSLESSIFGSSTPNNQSVVIDYLESKSQCAYLMMHLVQHCSVPFSLVSAPSNQLVCKTIRWMPLTQVSSFSTSYALIYEMQRKVITRETKIGLNLTLEVCPRFLKSVI